MQPNGLLVQKSLSHQPTRRCISRSLCLRHQDPHLHANMSVEKVGGTLDYCLLLTSSGWRSLDPVGNRTKWVISGDNQEVTSSSTGIGKVKGPSSHVLACPPSNVVHTALKGHCSL